MAETPNKGSDEQHPEDDSPGVLDSVSMDRPDQDSPEQDAPDRGSDQGSDPGDEPAGDSSIDASIDPMAPTLSSGPLEAPADLTGPQLPPAADDDLAGKSLLGQTISERYTILDEIGRGGMSIVYRARHELLKKTVAIKVLKQSLATDKVSLSRFHREAMAAASLGDLHIVDITDYGFTQSREAFIVMEYLEGQGLREVLKKEGPLEAGRCVSITRQILKALSAAHDQGIVHRDLKCDNVFLVPQEGREFVKLLDFGISKIKRPEGSEDTGLTATGVVMGTPQYIAPEQAHGVEDVDHRADIYSLGVILYEMSTGRLPFTGNSAIDILMKHIQQDPIPPRQCRPDLGISEELERVILKAMEKEPGDRYDSAEVMLEALPDARDLPGGYTSGALRPVPVASGRGTLGLFLALGAIVLLAGGALMLALHAGGPSLDPDAGVIPDMVPLRVDQAPAKQVAATPDAAARADSSTAAATVTITFKVSPPQARIYRDGTLLGPANGPRVLPRGTEEVTFEIRAAGGFRRQPVKVTPDRSQTRTIRLTRTRRPVTPTKVDDQRDNPYKKKRGGPRGNPYK